MTGLIDNDEGRAIGEIPPGSSLSNIKNTSAHKNTSGLIF